MDKKTDYFFDPVAEKYDENLADFFWMLPSILF